MKVFSSFKSLLRKGKFREALVEISIEDEKYGNYEDKSCEVEFEFMEEKSSPSLLKEAENNRNNSSRDLPLGR